MSDLIIFSNPLIGVLVIFGLRVVNMALDTLRMLFTLRGKKDVVLDFWIYRFIDLCAFVDLGTF